MENIYIYLLTLTLLCPGKRNMFLSEKKSHVHLQTKMVIGINFINVVVNLLSQVIFIFPLFQLH